MNPTPTALSILTLPAFQDNYLWLIHDGVHAAIVDPGDAEPVLAALDAHGLTLTAILLTHHHADHIGGVPRLLERGPVPVFGPRHDGIAAVTRPLDEGDRVQVPGLALALRVLEVPGHTLGHIAYVSTEADVDAGTAAGLDAGAAAGLDAGAAAGADSGSDTGLDSGADADGAGRAPWLFCGDTLFGAGCGRLFEGTPAQMAASLAKLAALPDATLVFCAHEYTLSNLRFAQAVEPENRALQLRVAHDSRLRGAGLPTIPSTIAIEKATNPFLRVAEPAIVASLVAAQRLAPNADPVSAFGALREWKNEF